MTYELSEPFDIDDDPEFAALTPQQAFVRGIEWERCRTICDVEGPGGFSMVVHSDNVARLAKVAARRGRSFDHRLFHDDWSTVFVGPDTGGGA